LHCLLPHVVVDAEDLVLVEHLAHDVVEVPRAREVVPDRLLEHDAGVLGEPPFPDPAHDAREDRGRRCAIEEPVPIRAEFGVEAHDTLVERDASARNIEWGADIEEPLCKRVPVSLVQSVEGELLDRAAGVLAEACVVEGSPTRPKHRVPRRLETLIGEVVLRGNQLATSEVAERAEDDHGLGRRRGKHHGAHPSARSRL
jgi:hypothetical protein